MQAATPVTTTDRIRQFNRRGAQWAAVASALAVTLPTAWLSLSTLAFVVFWLGAGDYAQR